MKVAVFKDARNILTLYEADECKMNTEHEEFQGYIDIEPKKPKKTVTKEVDYNVRGTYMDGSKILLTGGIPVEAVNIRILYDIEE